MEANIPSTPTPNYDWPSQINNDPPQNDSIIGEGDLESEQGSENPEGSTMEEMDRKSLLGIEAIYGPSNPVNGTMEPEVIEKFAEFMGQEMPREIIDIFQTSGYTKPWKIMLMVRIETFLIGFIG